jgi:hypothetical protein
MPPFIKISIPETLEARDEERQPRSMMKSIPWLSSSATAAFAAETCSSKTTSSGEYQKGGVRPTIPMS